MQNYLKLLTTTGFFMFSGVSTAFSQTPMNNGNNGQVDNPTSIVYTDGRTTDNTTQSSVVSNEVEDADIDAVLEQESKVGKPLPLSKAELARGDKARALADQMSAQIDSDLLESPSEFKNTPIPKNFVQYQKAWESRNASDGVYTAHACVDCIHAIQPRELMVTSIQLPKVEKISGFDLGDTQSFVAEIRNDFTLALKPLVHNVDTNLNIYTEGGSVHGFYLRALPLKSNLIPDVLVKIKDNELVPGKFGVKTMFEVQQVIENSAPEKLQISEVLENLRSEGESDVDFVRSIEFDPATLTGFKEYRIYGSFDKVLKPKVVFRDGQFTYIQWEDWDSTRLPTGYEVRDDLDKLLNTKVRGKTFIIESISPLITLKLGKSYLWVIPPEIRGILK